MVRVRLGETSRCHRDSVSGLVGPTALLDTDDSRRTGKYYWYIGMRNVLLGVFCDAIISRSYRVQRQRSQRVTVDMVTVPMVVSARPNDKIIRFRRINPSAI